MKRALILFLMVGSMGLKSLWAQDDVNLFNFWKYYSDIENSQYKYFCSEAFDQLALRKEKVGQLKTREDWMARQKQVRATIVKLIGGFPEKTPLNVRVTGVLKRDGYRVEKLIYESLPRYYVTAALFVPDKVRRNAPAILNAIGHSTKSFRRPLYQHVIINLVKKGFVVLTYDQIGQGERLQYYDEKLGKSPLPSTSEHSYPGAQCFISGYSPSRYFIWDAIRGIDYLLTRKEVDPERIGMTGLSGGGTATAFVSALDERILAAAPTCFLTNYQYLFSSIGPQDAEQNFYHFIYEGMDHPDLVELRAPRPTLMVTTTRDFFSIQGARETFSEAKRAYRAFGKEDLMQKSEADLGHGFAKKNNEATYAFFQKYLNNPGDPTDRDVDIIPESDLQVTETGQVITSMKDAETIYTLNKKIAEKQLEKLEASRKDVQKHLSKVTEAAKQISGFEDPSGYGRPVFSGRYRKTDYTLEKYLVPGSGDYALPAALYLPANKAKNEVILLLDEAGMEHAANRDSLAHRLVRNGHAVLLFDVPGIGSMGPGYLKGDAYIDRVSYNQWFAAILTGKSIVGLRAEDIIRMAHFVKEHFGEDVNIAAVSRGDVSAELIHAAVFHPEINKIALIDPLMSYADVVLTRDYKSRFIYGIVAGSIKEYDLPDLLGALNSRKILLINPLRANGKVAGEAEAGRALSFPMQVYSEKEISSNFRISTAKQDREWTSVWKWWLE